VGEEIADMLSIILMLFGPVILQIALSRMKRPWPGLILPGLFAFFSLYGIIAGGDILFSLFVANIPTVIFLLIYISVNDSFRERNRRAKAEREKLREQELEAMNIQDWE
jgi:hypothetical protein